MFLVNAIIIFITLLNIILYYLWQHQEEEEEEEEEYGERSNGSPLSSDRLCRRFSLAEIKLATQNFSEALVVGKGGFGKVYKGIIDDGASTVAIKRLDSGSKQGAPEFWTEIQMLSKFRHCHLVDLIGYCNHQREMIIVYQYMPGGTLEANLHKIHRSDGDNVSSLSWEQRLKICIGAARGLNYLHTGTSIQHTVIHRDVKSSNILLDENREAKISDFGLSRIGLTDQPNTHVTTHVKGTFGYIDPEYFLTRRLTTKSDVYAFGVVLFEALCGRPAVDTRLAEEQWGLAFWAKHCIKEGRLLELVDPSLRGSISSNCLLVFAEIANQCLQNSPKRRPTMSEVVTRLEYALALQEGTNSAAEDVDIISDTEDHEHLEDADSYTETEASNAGHNNEQIVGITQLGAGTSRSQSHNKPARTMTFVNKMVVLKLELRYDEGNQSVCMKVINQFVCCNIVKYYALSKLKQKAMKTVSGLSGVDSIAMNVKDKKLTLTGDIDPVTVVVKLRKLCFTSIVSVGPVLRKQPNSRFFPLPCY